MKITLIRHGISTSNEKKVYTGHSDVSLSENGVNELVNIKDEYDYPIGDFYLSSPLKRCQETFNILYPSIEIDHFFDDLKETNFGDWEGKSYSDLKDDPNYLRWMEDYQNVLPPNGESFISFNQRVRKVFNEILELAKENNKKNIVIFTHGGVIRSIMSQLIDSNVSFFEWEIPNGLGYEIYVDEQFKFNSIARRR